MKDLGTALTGTLILLLGMPALAQASPRGDTCRQEICESAVSACRREDPARNPTATATERKDFCGQFYADCMSRNIAAELPWYSHETVVRFLDCPP
jgi:hypothetical protein